MTDLSYLAPADVFSYFSEISSIPRGSGNTTGIRDYLVRFAEEKGLAYKTDKTGNVLITKEGTYGYEDHAPVALQGHVDMVCVKEEGCRHDFLNDPLSLKVKDGYLYAEGTSLGGDDGIAVAYMLAILSSDEIAHPPIEALFTVDEETGMDGAKMLVPDWITARRMINLDSEEEGVFTAGCAGGMDVCSVIPVKTMASRGIPVRVVITGLKGGHSGGVIQKPRASANKLLGRVLKELFDALPVSLSEVTGGEKRNAIATAASALLLADEEDVPEILSIANALIGQFRNEYKGSDDEITIRVTTGVSTSQKVLTTESADAIITYLLLVPHGVEKMNATIPDAVETSTNLGIIATNGKEFTAWSLTRSSVTSEKEALVQKIVLLTELLGGRAELSGDYPAWEFNPDSSLLTDAADVYADAFGEEAYVTVTHGGLECGLFSELIPDLEIISVGPNMTGVHTTNEKLDIASCERMYQFLIRLLGSL